MAQLHQIQVAYAPLQDRLLLRISTGDKSEFRFWITRRYLKLLWPVLNKLLGADPIVQRQADETAKDAVLNFRHEQVMQKAEMSKSFATDNASLPLGSEPVLLARIHTKQGENRPTVLCMHPEKGNGIELALNDGLLHAIVNLVSKAVPQADWELGFATNPVKPTSDLDNEVTIN
jgi:hypothetical protein